MCKIMSLNIEGKMEVQVESKVIEDEDTFIYFGQRICSEEEIKET